ncbi:hypothetical protein Mal48_40380 [Thalassoglobus polymorphus]|uniref:Uncharacterized protein n=1 Tax=Thalassoglobus polymorphus TaxID=2527994 RepID=A0A517QSZ4_9PLAN|nr:hypothetical protein Mal48_40380 [Thalassoglobus polymorphus]
MEQEKLKEAALMELERWENEGGRCFDSDDLEDEQLEETRVSRVRREGVRREPLNSRRRSRTLIGEFS